MTAITAELLKPTWGYPDYKEGWWK